MSSASLVTRSLFTYFPKYFYSEKIPFHRNKSNLLLQTNLNCRNANSLRRYSSNSDNSITSTVKFDSELVLDLADRARLSVSEEEVKEFSESLGRIVDWFGELQKVNVNDIPPAVRVDECGNDQITRPDVPVSFENKPELLAQVPEMDGPYLKVPKVMNEG